MASKNSILSEVEGIEIEEDTGFTYKSNSAKSWKSIVLNQYDSCVKEGSKEMNVGGVQKRILNNEVYEVVVPNQIEIFINNVEMLKRSLVSEIILEPEIAKKLNQFEASRKNLKKQFKEKRRKLLTWFNSLSDNKNPDGYSQRDIYEPKFNTIKQSIQNIYNENMLELYQEALFPFLTQLIAKRNYFEEN